MKNNSSISVIVFASNAERFIERCLSSLDFAGEVIVIDIDSTDSTAQISKKMGATVIWHKSLGYVEPVRNFGISKASGTWILVLDADEEVSPTLAAHLVKLAKLDACDGYYLPRKNMIFGQFAQTAGWWPDIVLRFFKKGAVEWTSDIHSIPVTKGKIAEIPPDDSLAIVHYNYQSVSEFVARYNRYTDIQVEEDLKKGKQINSPDAVLKAFFEEFFSRMFYHKGISGGLIGTILSMLQSSSELVRASKLWEHRESKLTGSFEPGTIAYLTQVGRELAFWLADWHVQHEKGLTQVFWRIRRRFRF
jgi:glycosyltransferase involved in cell wall biosynthesis